jgi:hypothetical protein
MRLREIDAKILEKHQALSKPDKFSGIKQLSRHEYDLEQSLLRTGSSNDKNVLSRLTRKAAATANKLEFCSKTVDTNGSRSADFRVQVEPPIESRKEEKLTAKFCLKCRKTFKSESDLKICEACVRDCCAETKEDGPATLCGPVKTISEEAIKRDRLSIEEIKDIPRFIDYSPGSKNKVRME